jgi:hypothetical protein
MSTGPDALLNLADAMAEDVLNTPDHEVLREVEEDFGDRRALANKFDQILEHTTKQVSVSGTARLAAFSQVRSFSLPDETIPWLKGIFDFGGRLSEFMSSLTPRTLAWSATAAVIVLVPAVVITAVVVKEQGAPGGQSSPVFATDQVASRDMKSDALPRAQVPGVAVGIEPPVVEPPAPSSVAAQPAAPVATEAAPAEPSFPPKRKLSDKEIATLVERGRKLAVAGDIHNARVVLQHAAEAGNATAALELGATYDPMELKSDALVKSPSAALSVAARAPAVDSSANIERKASAGYIERRAVLPDIAMARTWYQKAKDLGSPEAAGRLERLPRP